MMDDVKLYIEEIKCFTC